MRFVSLVPAVALCCSPFACTRDAARQTTARSTQVRTTDDSGVAPLAPQGDGVGRLGVYEIVTGRVFDERARDTHTFSDAGVSDGRIIESLVLGVKGDTPAAEIFRASGVRVRPRSDVLLLFYEELSVHDRPDGGYRWFLVHKRPVLGPSEISSCRVEEYETPVWGPDGNSYLELRPWIRLELTAAGRRILDSLGEGALLTVAFGSEAITKWWEPHRMEPTFKIDGPGLVRRQLRAMAMRAACTAQVNEAATNATDAGH